MVRFCAEALPLPGVQARRPRDRQLFRMGARLGRCSSADGLDLGRHAASAAAPAAAKPLGRGTVPARREPVRGQRQHEPDVMAEARRPLDPARAKGKPAFPGLRRRGRLPSPSAPPGPFRVTLAQVPSAPASCPIINASPHFAWPPLRPEKFARSGLQRPTRSMAACAKSIKFAHFNQEQSIFRASRRPASRNLPTEAIRC